MTKASAQKNLQDFYFLLFTFVSGFFYFFLSGQHYICISNDDNLFRDSLVGLGATNNSQVCSV